MRSDYIDIIEKALSAYTKERIRDYINEVKQNGLTEHGFPRLGVNTMLGCEDYGFFNKYMITVASNIYMGYIFADDSIKPTSVPAERAGI